MKNWMQNIIIQNIIKRLSKADTLRELIKHAASQGAVWIVAWVATAPDWLTSAINVIQDKTGTELVNEQSLTVLIGFIIAQGAQLLVDKINYKGIEKMQEGLEEVRDGWAGDETVGSLLRLKDTVSKYATEIIELKKALEVEKTKVAQLQPNQKQG